MTHAMVTFIAPLGLDKMVDAQVAIERLGNPAVASVSAALDLKPGEDEGTHFTSLHAVASPDGTHGYIILELSADGSEAAATARLLAALGLMLRPIFMFAADWRDGGDFGAYLTAHKVPIGNGLFGNPGLPFAGTSGFTVGRIRREDRLARACAMCVEAQDGDKAALARIEDVRRAVGADPDLRDALEPTEAAPPFTGNLGTLIGTGIGQVFTMYLWPLLALVVLAGLVGGLAEAAPVHGAWAVVGAFALGTVRMAWAASWVALALAVGAVILIYLALRRAEASDAIEVHSAQHDANRAMFVNENRFAQNHMISITQRKPGWLRWLTSRFAFWVIGLAATTFFRPGFLSDIGTIHFARWVTVPGKRDLVFLSNYGGSWESYLEDFIAKAHAGLTGVWSNTVGFPRTENLFQLGATDGDRFKRFARHSMVPTRFWYSAYPTLTTATVRSNAAIRAGLSGAMTEDEALDWLALFGSAARPAAKLASSDIQSLVFGGLKFMPFGTCMICTLPDDATRARAWLKAIRSNIAFNDGRRLAHDAVFTLALSWRGLRRLGLPAHVGPTFPFAFVEGMTQAERSRILGDVGDDAPEHWRWGSEPPDAAVLIYGRLATDVASLRAQFLDACTDAGMPTPFEVPLHKVEDGKKEPFGFVDGVSQPVIRGTYKSLRNTDPIHIVEPGEMLLGYPDNRGYFPPSPTLMPSADPGNKLPLLSASNDFARTVVNETRDVGFNGSFLVIRELAQDVEKFEAYCSEEATKLAGRLPAPYDVGPEFIAAKLVGRWRDGSSLVRNPYKSATDHRAKVWRRATATREAEPQEADHGAHLAAKSDAVVATSRPKSHPQEGTPIDPAGAPVEEHHPLTAAREERASKPIRPDNTFLFGVEDPQATRCPFGAHVRRANPRDSLDPGNADQVGISNRHRIIRVGRNYAPGPDQKPGLLFMCLCADIERQFEFLQQSWLKSPSFHGLSCEKDPLLGDGEKEASGFTVPSSDGPIGLGGMPRFVTTRGGAYFFLPGRRLIDFLADPL